MSAYYSVAMALGAVTTTIVLVVNASCQFFLIWQAGVSPPNHRVILIVCMEVLPNRGFVTSISSTCACARAAGLGGLLCL